jgi:hypothetical protein
MKLESVGIYIPGSRLIYNMQWYEYQTLNTQQEDMAPILDQWMVDGFCSLSSGGIVREVVDIVVGGCIWVNNLENRYGVGWTFGKGIDKKGVDGYSITHKRKTTNTKLIALSPPHLLPKHRRLQWTWWHRYRRPPRKRPCRLCPTIHIQA